MGERGSLAGSFLARSDVDERHLLAPVVLAGFLRLWQIPRRVPSSDAPDSWRAGASALWRTCVCQKASSTMAFGLA